MTRIWLQLIAWLGLLIAATAASAHEARPAYLEINELGPDQYAILWRAPANGGLILPVRVQLPAELKAVSPPAVRDLSDSRVETWLVRSPDGLAGKRIDFIGLPGTITDVLVRIQYGDGREFSALVRPSRAWIEIPEEQGPFAVAGTYSLLGIEHILLGFDHLCFVLALVLVVRGTRRLIWTVTAFTVAHSITLALATLEVVRVPGPPVEATIALSIIFVANEIIQQRRGREGLASKRPWLVAFAFGLLHGLGFAGALAEVGLPANAIPLALLFFNVGVEIGQLLFIAGVLLAMRLLTKLATQRPEFRYAPVAAAYAIGGIASYWVIERVSGFWG